MPRWELHTFYNPKKDLKALHLGTYPLHLYEIARGSSHETLFFYSMGIQSSTSCPRPTKKSKSDAIFSLSGNSRSETAVRKIPRLPFNAYDCPSMPAHAAAAFNNSLFLLRSSSAGDCKPGKLPELSCLLRYDRNFCIPKP